MDVNMVKTKIKNHKYISLKQKDNQTPIELILCGPDGKPLSTLTSACTVTLLDTVDNEIRQKSNEQITNGELSFKVTNDLKAHKHSLEITTLSGNKFPSDGNFEVFVSTTHDEAELRVINSLTRDEALSELDQSVKTFISANTQEYVDKAATAEWLVQNEFKPRTEVATFSALPKPAELKEMRLVVDENKQYIYDGTAWVEFGAVNADGLSLIKQDVSQTEKVIFVENYGAVGDGVTDDSEAFYKAINAFPSARSLKILLKDKTYKINKQLYFSRRIKMVGKGIDKTYLNFVDAVFHAAPYAAGLIAVHPDNINKTDGVYLPIGQIGTDGKNSLWEDFTIMGAKSKGQKEEGYIINTPVETNRVRVVNAGANGQSLLGSTTKDGVFIGGNCNHAKIRQTSSYGCGGHGIFISGANANTFVLDLPTVYANDGWGIFDDSFLGGVVIGAEADGNKTGAFASSPSNKRPSRTVWLGTYAEGNHPINYNLSSRHIILGATGSLPETGQNYLGGLMDKGLYSARPLTIADTEQIGYDFNGINGKALRLSKDKLEVYGTQGQLPMKIEQDGLSANYGAFRLGTIRSILFPYTDLTAALLTGRPYFAAGYALGQYVSFQEGTAPPTSGTYVRGQRIINSAPAPGGYESWVCVTSGSPGIWKGSGKIEL